MSQDMIQYLVRDTRDPAGNMARYYVLSIEPSLLGDTSRIRECGRICQPGPRRGDLHENQTGGAEALDAWLERKQLRGYVLRQEEH